MALSVKNCAAWVEPLALKQPMVPSLLIRTWSEVFFPFCQMIDYSLVMVSQEHWMDLLRASWPGTTVMPDPALQPEQPR